MVSLQKTLSGRGKRIRGFIVYLVLAVGCSGFSLDAKPGPHREVRAGTGLLFREARLEVKKSAMRYRADPSRESSISRKYARPLRQPTPRIVGGDDSTPGDFPWMVALLNRGEEDRFYAQFCGGALIHPYWVLTAAHCVEGDQPENVDVLIGAHDLASATEGERIEVVEIIFHPEYDTGSLDGDAALLRLARPAASQPIRVNSTTAVEMPGLLSTILGWGALDADGDSYPEVLQEAQVPLVDFETANGIWEDSLTERMLAAGNLAEGGVDSCQGDSGGPLVVRDVDGQWTLAGLTSFGDSCAAPNSPGIYTRVSEIRDWLLPLVRPEYAAWEKSAGGTVIGEDSDPDGDRWSNFSEFAFATDPILPDQPEVVVGREASGPMFSFRRPVGASEEVDYVLRYRTTMAETGVPLSIDAQLLNSLSEGDSERLELRFPDGPRGFVSLSAEVPEALAHAVRPVVFPGRAHSSISTDLRRDAFERRYQEFRFPEQPLGETVYFLAESSDFDLRLELYDAATGALLAYSASNSGAGSDELLAFTATTVPLVRVLSESGGMGAFSLTGYTERANDGSIGLNGSVAGELTTADELDPIYSGDFDYFKQDYLLEFPASFSGSVTITLSSTDFDAYLMVLDALTGQLIDENDDYDGLNAQLSLFPDGRGSVLLRVTTALDRETGDFLLETVAP